ncbi:helix-turn-helix domain-containing protein [Flagellimonas sp.]
MQKILELDDIDSISIKIEEYWIKKRIGFEHPFLFDSIHKIQENPKIKTSELASSYNISQKTLITHFKRHLCKTPTEFKKILRFRKALTKMQSANKKTRLTELSYMIDFFDQSHMVGDFKSLTGISPKAFFKKLKCIENSNIHWIFT